MAQATAAGAAVNPLSGFVLHDQDEAEVQLDRLWRDRAAAIVFLRHYLCVQCRVGAMELERDRDLLGPDPNVWLIGMGTALQARAFKQQTGVRFPVLLSADLGAYEAMNLPRGSLRQIFGIAAQRVRGVARRASARSSGRGRQPPQARPEQDWHQLGGAFVFARGGQPRGAIVPGTPVNSPTTACRRGCGCRRPRRRPSPPPQPPPPQ
jgi:hypothetical protein